MSRPQHLPRLLALVGALLLLVSLYLPWQQASTADAELHIFGESLTLDAWSTQTGDAAALLSVLLVVAALLNRGPLAHLALTVAYFGVGAAVETGATASAYSRSTEFRYEVAYGTYVGFAAVALAAIAAVTLNRRELLRRSAQEQLPVVALAGALLVALLLPWVRIRAVGSFPAIEAPPAVMAAALAASFPYLWRARLILAASLLVLVGALFSLYNAPGAVYAYGAWTALGLALALILLTVQTRPPLPQLVRPWWRSGARLAAAAVLVTSLFLPWNVQCQDGSCRSTNGWLAFGTAAAALAIAFAVWPAPELALGVGVFVATMGFQLAEADYGTLRLEFGYGSTIGFAAAALLVMLGALRLHRPDVDGMRFAPVGVAIAYVAVIVVPWWGVLPERLQTFLRFSGSVWLPIAGALLGIALVGLWLRGAGHDLLAVVPLTMAALAVPDAIRPLEEGVVEWGALIVLALCALLAWLGFVELRRGLRNVRVPEFFRVDRI